MTATERESRRVMQDDILAYVRGMQKTAPVTVDSIASYLRVQRRWKVTNTDVEDLVVYLREQGCLNEIAEWDPAEGREMVRYEIAAKGMDVLDGTIPPLNWGNKKKI